jgi:hypothetical protein
MASVRTYVPSIAAIISSSWATSMRFDLPERGEGGREVKRERWGEERGREEVGKEGERKGWRKRDEEGGKRTKEEGRRGI